MLIPQRFSGFEHVADPLVSLLVPGKVEERFLLQLEQILLRHPLGQRQFPASEDAGDVAGDHAVVLRSVSTPLHGLYLDIECRPRRLSRGEDLLSPLRGHVAAGEVEYLAPGGGEEVVRVHHHPVVLVEEAQLLGLQSAARGLRQRYGLEGFLQEGQRRRLPGGAQRGGDEPARQLFSAAAGRDQTYPRLDEPHVRLPGGDDAICMEADLQSSSERLSVRYRDDGLGREAEAHEQVLEVVHPFADLVEPAVLRGVGDLAYVRPDAEVPTLVADDEPDHIVPLQLLERPVPHLDDGSVYGVAFCVELEAEDAVSQVQQARRVVAGDLRALLAQPVQGDDHGVLADRLVSSLDRAVDQLPAPFLPVEALVAAVEHLFDPRGDLDVHRLRLLDRVPDAEEVPGTERAGLVHEAPLHRVVHVLQGVGDLRHPAGGVGEVRKQSVPDKAGVPVLVGHLNEEAQPRPEISLLPGFFGYGDLRVLRRLVFEGFEIEDIEDGLAVAPGSLVEAGPGLVAEEVAIQHLHEFWVRFYLLARLVPGGGLVEVLGDADGDVEADLVVQTKSGGPGVPDQGPGQGIDLLYAVAVLEGVPHRLHPGEAPEPVPDEVRRVLRDDAALAQNPLPEVAHEPDDLGVGLSGWDDLQELQVARRVEEVRTEKASPEALTTALGYLVQRYAGGVGGDDRVIFGDTFQPLDNGFEDPVSAGDPVEVVLEVAQRDPVYHPLAHDRGGAGLSHPLEAGLDDVVVVAVVRSDIQQVHLETRVGAVGRDGGAHGPRAENSHPAYPVRHRTSTSFPQSLPSTFTIASRHGWRREVLECGAA